MSESNNKPKKTLFEATIEDANDGSGDGILTFPPDFIEQEGWQEGDVIHMSTENDKLIIQNKSLRQRLDNTLPKE
jgi:hypothetical protein